MSTHLNVENLNETVGEFMQRRVNFLVSALGTINTSLEAASETIDVDVQMQPYRLENIADKQDRHRYQGQEWRDMVARTRNHLRG